MTRFEDSKNQTWEITINLGTARFVRDNIGINLLNPTELNAEGQNLIARLMYDDLVFGDVILALLNNQGLKPADVDGEFLKAAENPFWLEYRLFFQARGKKWAASAILAGLAERETNEKQAEELLTGATSSN